jgi:hypothetical protein
MVCSVEDSEVLLQFIRNSCRRAREAVTWQIASCWIALSLQLACASEPLTDIPKRDAASPAEATSSAIAPDAFWGVGPLVHAYTIPRGAASCAATACHGGPSVAIAATDAVRGSEYPLFVESDPHSRSWLTLNSPLSIEILTKLGILRDGAIANPTAYQNCLACHNTDRSQSPDRITPNIAEGVGCESCHGPAESWYDSHYQGPHSVLASKSERGMIDTKPLLQRARTCTLCHVGAADRDMNHDIIAAGHPALYFDMAIYHDAYPKHWRDPEAKDPAFRAQLWLAGQIAKADAELELLQTRAAKAHSVSVWPEFAQFRCTSCHITLDGLPPETAPPQTLGAIDWETLGRASVRRWNLQGAAALFAPAPGVPTRQSESMPTWDERGEPTLMLSALLAELNSPNAPAGSIAQKAGELRPILASLAADAMANHPRWTLAQQRASAAAQLHQAIDSKDWEDASLAYIATWAALQRPAPQAVESDMDTARAGLVFPFRSQSPRFPRSDASSAPPTRQQWTDAIERILLFIESVEP